MTTATHSSIPMLHSIRRPVGLPTLIFVFVLITPLAAQSMGDPCRAYGNVKGWTFDLKVTASGTSYKRSNTAKYTLERTASLSGAIDHLRDQSSIFGPNGEVIQVVWEGRSESTASVNDKEYVKETTPPGWIVTNTWTGSGGVNAQYDTPLNTNVSVQPTTDGRCSFLVEFPTDLDATYGWKDNKTWKTMVFVYNWATASALSWVPLKTSVVPAGGSPYTLIWDYVPADTSLSMPAPIQRTLVIQEMGWNGAIVDWTFQWTLSPVGTCGTTEPSVSAVENVTGFVSAEMWWFNGEQPANYNQRLTLRALPPSTCIHQWVIESGSDKANFVAPSSSYITYLKALSPSTRKQDVRIRVRRNGVLSPPFYVTVRAPSELQPLGTSDLPHVVFGYESRIHYRILDQFRNTMPKDVPVNENWLSDVVPDYPGTNWRRYDFPGVIAPLGVFDDQIGGAAVGFGFIPPPIFAPANNTKVQHWEQGWSVGSITAGAGRPVQNNTLRKYQGHAIHENVRVVITF